MSTLRIILAVCLTLTFGARSTSAQDDESKLRIFGYFQTLFQHQTDFFDRREHNSFSLQQLNLFLQRELAPRWTGFVNIEAINSYHSKRDFGSLKIEEAWLRYRLSGKLSVKAGLQIPTFNNLNEIKNRTPLLPYAIRPHVYETSFEDFVTVEEYLPTRGFVQAYGFLPSGKFKLDYAAFLGNTSLVNSDPQLGQTGVDTTTSVLVGGRLGIRYRTLKLGFSATHERASLESNAIEATNEPRSYFENVPRVRFGADLSLDYENFYVETEWIHVRYKEKSPSVEANKSFYYATLGYYLDHNLFAYAGYWYNHEQFTIAESDVRVRTGGISYHFLDSITFKAQVARANVLDELKVDLIGFPAESLTATLYFYTAAVSVFF